MQFSICQTPCWHWLNTATPFGAATKSFLARGCWFVIVRQASNELNWIFPRRICESSNLNSLVPLTLLNTCQVLHGAFTFPHCISTGGHSTVECGKGIFPFFALPHTLVSPKHNADGQTDRQNTLLFLLEVPPGPCGKLVGKHISPHFTAALHQDPSWVLLHRKRRYTFQGANLKVMFYLIPQSKGEQKHHTSTCHALFGLLAQIQHLIVLSSLGTADENSCED